MSSLEARKGSEEGNGRWRKMLEECGWKTSERGAGDEDEGIRREARRCDVGKGGKVKVDVVVEEETLAQKKRVLRPSPGLLLI